MMGDEARAMSELAGNQEGEAVLPTDGNEATINELSTPVGVNVDVLQLWMTDMMVKMDCMATREESREVAAQQEERMWKHVADMATQQTENIRAAVRGEMEAMETRVNKFTNEACARVKEELKEEVKEEVKEKIRDVQWSWQHRQETMMRDVQACFTKVATLESTVAALVPSSKSAPKASSELSIPSLSDELQMFGRENELPFPGSPPRSPSPPSSVTGNVDHHQRQLSVVKTALTEKKLAEYDGKVSWNAYQAQFEAAASRHDWTEAEKAYQLVTSLKGVAVEVLEHLTATQLQSYSSLTSALQRRFGRRQQPELYRAQLKTRRRREGESLAVLAQDVETLVRGAYPMAAEDTVDMLAKDCFVDALCDRQLQVHVKQAAPT